MRERLAWAGQVVAWLVILAVAAVLLAAVVVPRAAGATPYTVLTGSMRPALPEGTLVVVRPVEPDEVGVGDVLTYQLESGRATVVTHRVTAVSSDLGGDIRYTTRGDANGSPDAESVRPVQVRGEVWYSVPHLGHLNAALTGEERRMLVHVVAALLLGYAAFMVTTGLRERRRDRQEVV